MNITQFISSSVDQHVDCFSVLLITGEATSTIHVKVFGGYKYQISQGNKLRLL